MTKKPGFVGLQQGMFGCIHTLKQGLSVNTFAKFMNWWSKDRQGGYARLLVTLWKILASKIGSGFSGSNFIVSSTYL